MIDIVNAVIGRYLISAAAFFCILYVKYNKGKNRDVIFKS